MRSILVDTNVLLDNAETIYKLAKEYDEIVIPITVLKELDVQKKVPDLAYSARSAINTLKEFKTLYPNKLRVIINSDDISTNDERIIRAAKDSNSILATKDLSMSLISESMGVETKLYSEISNGLYKPYLRLNSQDLPYEFSYKQLYNYSEYHNLFNDIFIKKGYDKQMWFFVFISEGTETKAVYANNVPKGILERIDNVGKYREIINREKNVELKAKDNYQVCAIFALVNAPNVLITGKFGSGKSLIATAHCMSTNEGRTFISRAPIPISKAHSIGFMPGTLEDKMLGWCAGILSSVYFLVANTRGQRGSKGKSVDYDFVKDSVFQEYFSIMPLHSLQGLSLLEGDVMLVDEVQLIDINTLSSILSRGSEGSKIILLGDLKQNFSLRPSESGLLKLLRVLPHNYMAYVDLQQSFRSPLLEIAETLQSKEF